MRKQRFLCEKPFDERKLLEVFGRKIIAPLDLWCCAPAEELLREENAMALQNRRLPPHHKRKRYPAREVLQQGQRARLEEYEQCWKERRAADAQSGEKKKKAATFYYANLSQHPCHFNRLGSNQRGEAHFSA